MKLRKADKKRVIEQIDELLLDGMSVADIASTCDVSQSFVYVYINGYSEKKEERRLNPAELLPIAESVNFSPTQVSKLTGMPYSRIYHALAELVDFAKLKEEKNEKIDEVIRAYMRKELTLHEAVAASGKSQSVFYLRMKKLRENES